MAAATFESVIAELRDMPEVATPILSDDSTTMAAPKEEFLLRKRRSKPLTKSLEISGKKCTLVSSDGEPMQASALSLPIPQHPLESLLAAAAKGEKQAGEEAKEVISPMKAFMEIVQASRLVQSGAKNAAKAADPKKANARRCAEQLRDVHFTKELEDQLEQTLSFENTLVQDTKDEPGIAAKTQTQEADTTAEECSGYIVALEDDKVVLLENLPELEDRFVTPLARRGARARPAKARGIKASPRGNSLEEETPVKVQQAVSLIATEQRASKKTADDCPSSPVCTKTPPAPVRRTKTQAKSCDSPLAKSPAKRGASSSPRTSLVGSPAKRTRATSSFSSPGKKSPVKRG